MSCCLFAFPLLEKKLCIIYSTDFGLLLPWRWWIVGESVLEPTLESSAEILGQTIIPDYPPWISLKFTWNLCQNFAGTSADVDKYWLGKWTQIRYANICNSKSVWEISLWNLIRENFQKKLFSFKVLPMTKSNIGFENFGVRNGFS